MALTTFSDLMQEARELIRRDTAITAGFPDDGKNLAYGDARATAFREGGGVSFIICSR